jgi:hypothetical protein
MLGASNWRCGVLNQIPEEVVEMEKVRAPSQLTGISGLWAMELQGETLNQGVPGSAPTEQKSQRTISALSSRMHNDTSAKRGYRKNIRVEAPAPAASAAYPPRNNTLSWDPRWSPQLVRAPLSSRYV